MIGAEVAAALAPEVDRLVIAVHRRMRDRREEVAALLERCGVPSPALLVDLRPFLLVGDEIPEALVTEFARFIPADRARAIRHDLSDSGALVGHGQVLTASPGARRFAAAMTEMQAEVMADAWSASGAAVTAAAPICADILNAVDPDPELVVFSALRTVPEPQAPLAFLLHHRLTMLRYVRAGHHAAALSEHGLTAEQARLIDRVWRTVPSGDVPAPTICHELRLWLDDATGALTTEGRRRRLSIEHDTNVLAGAPLSKFAEAARLPALLAELPE